MTPQRKHKRELAHINCELVIRLKATKNPMIQHHGLYCREHGTWFKWLGARERAQYLSLGVAEE